MRTLKYRNTYASQPTDETVLDVRVQEHRTITIVSHTTDASNGTLKVYYVFANPDETEDDEFLYETISLTQNTLNVKTYNFKLPHIRLKYTGGGASGTVRIDATTAR